MIKDFMQLLLTIFTLFSSMAIAEEPWGNDADLLQPKIFCEKEIRQSNFLVNGARILIKFHQNVISPADGPRSHYYPSSSQYTLEAIQKYGFFYGWLLGCDRLMRENSEEWVYKTTVNAKGLQTKLDPVP